ncbi:MAG: GntR family transcriptional regulator [Kiritimatiellae bacterium]|nr:GntR family transcriptional regulator [Kiritimatiellia bacterium]
MPTGNKKSEAKVYEQVASFLKEKIATGEIKIGEAIYSENVLCQKLGVSRTSVRKAVRQLVGENILISRQGAGSFVKGVGQGFIHNAICLCNYVGRSLHVNIADTFYQDIIRGVEAEVNRRKKSFVVFSDLGTTTDLAGRMDHIECDGLLVDPNLLRSGGGVDQLKKIAPNIVAYDANPGEVDIPCVCPDYRSGFEQILEHTGADRLGKSFFMITQYESGVREAVEAVAADNGLAAPVCCDYLANLSFDAAKHVDHYPLVFESLSAAIAEHGIPELIVATNGNVAAKVLTALKQKAIMVPEDISVVALNGMHIATMTDPPIAALNVDSFELGKLAVAFLFELIENKTAERIRYLPVTFLPRASLRWK